MGTFLKKHFCHCTVKIMVIQHTTKPVRLIVGLVILSRALKKPIHVNDHISNSHHSVSSNYQYQQF